jgi:hypothetical protein
MARTIVSLFDSLDDANHAVQGLINNGVPRDDISLIAGDRRGEWTSADAARTGATAGTAIGGGLGLLAGLGALAIPGIGPALAAGPLAAALGLGVAGAAAGAATGGLIGALTEAGVSEEHAHVYAESVRRGSALVVVTSDAILGSAIYDILQRYNPVDVDVRREHWRERGWERFDPVGDPSRATDVGDSLADDWQESSKVGTAAGATAGAVTGAAIGSVAGPIGTIIGGIAGAAVGGGVGAAGDVAGKEAEEVLGSGDDEEQSGDDRR